MSLRLALQLASGMVTAVVVSACSLLVDPTLDGLPCGDGGACRDGFVCSGGKCVVGEIGGEDGAVEEPCGGGCSEGLECDELLNRCVQKTERTTNLPAGSCCVFDADCVSGSCLFDPRPGELRSFCGDPSKTCETNNECGEGFTCFDSVRCVPEKCNEPAQ